MTTDPKMPEPVAYLYHDADKPENAHPLFHSTMLVMPFGRREGGRNETPLITTTAAQAYAEALAAARVAQERERWEQERKDYRSLLMQARVVLRGPHAQQNIVVRELVARIEARGVQFGVAVQLPETCKEK